MERKGIIKLSAEAHAKLQRKNKKNSAFKSSKNSSTSDSDHTSNFTDSRSRNNFNKKPFQKSNQQKFGKENKKYANNHRQHFNKKIRTANLIKEFQKGHLNDKNLTEYDKEKINWLYAGPENSPEAKDLPLPEMSWINHFSIHGKQVLSAR